MELNRKEMKKGTELRFAKPDPRLVAACISAISGLCQSLKNDDLDTPEAKKAISDFQNNQDALSVFLRLTLTDEDLENRRVMDEAVKIIRDKKRKIDLT